MAGSWTVEGTYICTVHMKTKVARTVLIFYGLRVTSARDTLKHGRPERTKYSHIILSASGVISISSLEKRNERR